MQLYAVIENDGDGWKATAVYTDKDKINIDAEMVEFTSDFPESLWVATNRYDEISFERIKAGIRNKI